MLSFVDRFAFQAIAFACFGTLFLFRPSTWLHTLTLVLGLVLVVFSAEFRTRLKALFRQTELMWVAWPFAAWFAVALTLSLAHATSSNFSFPENELRIALALTILCYVVQKEAKQTFYIGLVIAACSALAWCLYEREILGVIRSQATTNNPIHFGNLTALLALICLSVSLIENQRSSNFRKLMLVASVLAALASLASLSRSSAIIVLCAWPLFNLPRDDLFRKRAISLMAVFFITLILIVGFSSQVRERLRINEFTAAFNNPDQIDYDRLTGNRGNMWHAATLMFKAHPLIGVGPAGFPSNFLALKDDGAVKITEMHNQPHNDILDVVSRGGSLKLLSYVGLICGPFVFFYRRYKSMGDVEGKLFPLLGMQSVGAFVLTGLTNSNFDLQIYSTMYAVLVCVIAKLCLELEDPHE